MSVLELCLIGTVVFLLAGSIKGLVGIGLPTASISFLTLAMDPRSAIALVLAPMVVSNAWQVWQMGEIGRALRDYAGFAVALMVGVFATVILSAEVSDRVIFPALGISAGKTTGRILPGRSNKSSTAGSGAVRPSWLSDPVA